MESNKMNEDKTIEDKINEFRSLTEKFKELKEAKIANDERAMTPIELFIVILSIPLVILMSGLVIKILWAWFISPFGIGQIGIAHALGLGTLYSYLTDRGYNERKSDPKAPVYMMYLFFIGKVLVTLGFAWVIHLFV